MYGSMEWRPSDLKDKIIYVENDCKDIWDWSEKVYQSIEQSTDI